MIDLVELVRPAIEAQVGPLLVADEVMRIDWHPHSRRFVVVAVDVKREITQRHLGQFHAITLGSPILKFYPYKASGDCGTDAFVFPHGKYSRKESEAWSDWARER